MRFFRVPMLLPHLLLTLGFVCTSVLFTANANAQALGRSGDFVISAERVFGAYATRQEVDDPGGFVVRDTSIGFLTHRRPGSILTSPRIGFDYFVARSFSIGGVIAVYSGDVEDSGFLLAPRVGYALPFNNRWGFWPRGGLTFSSENEPDRTQIALSVEGAFYFMPNGTVGFTLAPFADLGIVGEHDTGIEREYSDRAFGLAFGMFARF